MKSRWAVLLCLVIGGCCTHKSAPPSTTEPVAVAATEPLATTMPVPPEPAVFYAESPAPVLAFDPPAIANQPPLELARDDRRPAAFVGWDGPITTYFWIHTDDFQDYGSYGLNGSGANGWGGNGGSGDRYQRDAQFDQIGVRTR